MDIVKQQEFIEGMWEADVMPTLLDYMSIPCESPAFDPQWFENGHLDRATELLAAWAREKLHMVPGATVEVVRLPGRTPVILIDVPGDPTAPVLIYGHLDKQPPMAGWAPGRGAWAPVIEDDRLYGRGGADDGYAIFSAVTAILALRVQGLNHPRSMILIEATEESGSTDLPYYMEQLTPRMGAPSVVIVLDAGCASYDRLWLTTSLRGQVAGVLTVRVLREAMHSGDAAGIVPSSFRIASRLLSRLEDPATGDIVVPQLHTPIPDARRHEASTTVAALGARLHGVPFPAGMTPVTNDLVELTLNRSWRPQLAITGIDGLPSVANAAAVMQPFTSLKLSVRLPPTLDPEAASHCIKATLEADPPYGCDVSFRIDMVSKGWHAPSLAPWLQSSLHEGSTHAFGSPSAPIGGGGSIPFLAMLAKRFPQAQFVVTGVLGPESNAHGPNEFLHLPTAKRITAVVAHVVHAAYHKCAASDASQGSGNRRLRDMDAEHLPFATFMHL